MAIFNSYVSLPEGTLRQSNMAGEIHELHRAASQLGKSASHRFFARWN